MRVGMIVYGLGSSVTGIGRYTIQLAEALHNANGDVELILIAAGSLGALAPQNIPYIQLKTAKLLPALLTSGSVQLPGIARRHSLDVIHDPTGAAPFAFGTGRAKSVTTIHDVVPLSFPGVSTRLDSLIYTRWLPRITPRLNAIITVSEASKRDIIHHYKLRPERVHAIPNAADAHFHPATPEDIDRVRAKYALPERYLLFVGSIEERKNLKRVLEAYSRIQHNIPQRLVIVGPKKWKYQQITTALQDLNLEESVIFTGYADQADLPVIYSGSDAFIYPSLYEGFGMPPLEAMACGVPVITSNTSSLPEVVGEAALLVDPYDVEALAGAMQKIVTDADLSARLRAAGLARAAGFSWERSAAAVAAVYRQLV